MSVGQAATGVQQGHGPSWGMDRLQAPGCPHTCVTLSALIDVLSQMLLEQMWMGPTVPSKSKSVGIENVGFNVRPIGDTR